MQGVTPAARGNLRRLVAAAALATALLHGGAAPAGAACTLPADLAQAAARLTAQAVPWQVPPAVRESLDACDLTGARQAVDAAAGILEAVAVADGVLPAAEVRAGAVRARFEGAMTLADLDAAAATASHQLEAARVVAAALAEIAEPRPGVVALGIAPAKLEAEQVTAIAAVTAADLDAARAAAAFIDQELADEAEAARLVGAARARVVAARGPLETVGLAVTDFTPRLDLALAAVQGINLPSARHLTSSIDADLDGAAAAGLVRIAAAVAAILLAVFALRRRVRPRTG